MNAFVPRLVLFCAAQIIAVTAIWHLKAGEREWSVLQQFFGHMGPAIFLVAAGVAALYLRHNLRRLAVWEAWLAVFGGGLYVLADTFLMHPPWGVFDGAGQAEQEHVAITSFIFVLGVSMLVLMRKIPGYLPTSAHFVIGVVVTSMVFLNHHQHTVSGTVGHEATIVLLAAAAVFRVLDKTVEYAITMIVVGFVFYSSQQGFAEYVDTAGNSPGAWVALWITMGFASTIGFLALAPADETVPAE